MSEVNDAIQIIIVSGRGAYILGNITVKSALSTIKLLETIYLAKWKGRTSLRRFRQIKGDDFQFINVGSESASVLRQIEKEMESHGILMARLPDLCGGDGRTQYVISDSDMGKFKAFLLDHSAGALKQIKVGPINAEDYARTGLNRRWEPTSEMAHLTASALQQSQRENKVNVQKTEVMEVTPEFREIVRRHDMPNLYKNHVKWLPCEPVKTHTNWGLYLMQDKEHCVIIPKSDMSGKRVNSENGKVQPAQAAIFDSKNYIVVRMSDGEQQLVPGTEIARQIMQSDTPVNLQKKTRVNINVMQNDNPVNLQKKTRVTINEKLFLREDEAFFVSRIPYSKEYVKIPKEHCIMYRNGKTMAAWLRDGHDYTLEDARGQQAGIIKGTELKKRYDDKTGRHTEKTQKQPVSRRAVRPPAKRGGRSR